MVNIGEDGFDCNFDKDAFAAEVTANSKGSRELIEKRLKRGSAHINSITQRLDKLREMIDKSRLYGKGAIGVRIGKVINKYKVGKHFKLNIGDNGFNLLAYYV